MIKIELIINKTRIRFDERLNLTQIIKLFSSRQEGEDFRTAPFFVVMNGKHISEKDLAHIFPVPNSTIDLYLLADGG